MQQTYRLKSILPSIASPAYTHTDSIIMNLYASIVTIFCDENIQFYGTCTENIQ